MKLALSLFLFAALALAALGHSSARDQAMAQCQQLHSYDTCFTALN